MGTQPAP